MKLLLTFAIVSLLCGLGHGHIKQYQAQLMGVVELGKRAFNLFENFMVAPKLPHIETNKYWGPGDVSTYKENTKVNAFTVPEMKKEIEELNAILSKPLNLVENLEGTTFEYGFHTKTLRYVVYYWRENYLKKWESHRIFLNKFNQFTTNIQGLNIHFIHVRANRGPNNDKKVIPLLLLHGWPGSVREFYDIIPLLTNPSQDKNFPYVFDVVVPSMVGFGWSEAAHKPGFDPSQMAVVMRNLMVRLKYETFLVQGGDWGSIIGNVIATIFPENVIGYHSNMCTLNTPLSTVKLFLASLNPLAYIPSKKFYGHHFPLQEKLEFILQESGYYHLQATKPDTIGAALLMNPVGLAAYMLEKFQTSSDISIRQNMDTLWKVYNRDGLLDNIMIYYLSKTATSAARLYAEGSTKAYNSLQLTRVVSPVPMGCARFKNDLPSALKWQLLDKFPNLIHSTYYNIGGHYAAFEIPNVLYKDFTDFVNTLYKKK